MRPTWSPDGRWIVFEGAIDAGKSMMRLWLINVNASTSDSGYYVGPYDMFKKVVDDRERYRRLSPVQHLKNATTPTLIRQGEDDLRCPLEQSEEIFSLLMQEQKAPAELVIYPSAHHSLAEDGKPSQRLHYHGAITDWCERWRR